MAKNTFLDWDQTASNNTDVGGIGIQGTNAVSNFDDALRTVMAQLRAGVDGEVAYITKSANYTAVANDNNAFLRFSAASTLSLTAAATLGVNWHVLVQADGGDVIIDPNGAETINGSATITIPDGLSTLVICNGTNFIATKNYSVISSKLSALQPYVSIASATTTDLSTTTSVNVTVTGTTTITSFGTVAAGTFRRLVFSGSLTLTHNATSLILPQGASVVTQAGDSLEAVSLGSGNWRVTSYQKAGLPITSATSQVTTSGTAFDFLNIPPGVKRVTVMFDLVSLSGTDDILVQMGTSGGLETTGYSAGSGGASTSAAGFIVRAANAARAPTGHMVLTNQTGNTWISSHVIHSDTTTDIIGGGRKVLAGTLDRIRITRTGTDTFDSGAVNILYE